MCQADRLIVGAVMPNIADDKGLSTQQKGWILSAFSLGYMFTQIIGGMAADRYGGKILMSVAIFSSALFLLISPAALDSVLSVTAFTCVMFVMGALQGPTYPVNGVLLGKWAHKSERSTASAIADAGGPFGALACMALGPFLASWFGWQIAFYAMGFITFVFACVWHLFAHDSPSSCLQASPEEVAFLNVAKSKQAESDEGPFPWNLLLCSPVLTVYFAHCNFNFLRYFVYSWMMTFLVDVVRVRNELAGFYMMWPQVVDGFSSLMVGAVADTLCKRGLSLAACRRLFGGTGFVLSGVGILACGACEQGIDVAVCLCIIAFGQSLQNAGYKTNYLDITSTYSGTIMGVGNMLATGASVLAPVGGAEILARTGGSWPALFSILFCVSIASAARFSCCCVIDNQDHRAVISMVKKVD